MTERTFIILGASLAGAKAAEELRERGFDGKLVLVGSELERPYERPPLTKDYLRGESEREKAYVHPERFYDEHDIELLSGVTATSIDPAASTVALRRWARAALRPAAADDRRAAARDHGPGRRSRRRPLPAHARRLRHAESAPGRGRPCGRRRRRMDRQRVRGIGPPERAGGGADRSARAARRTSVRRRRSARSTATSTPSTASSCCSATGCDRSRATAPSRA